MSKGFLPVVVTLLLAGVVLGLRLGQLEAPEPPCVEWLPDEDPLLSVRERANAEATTEVVLLGSDELFGGLPGHGPLSIDSLYVWLEAVENHRPLSPELPLGMNSGAADLNGLAENPLTRAKIELGRQLFFDKRLSVDATVSCASCHDPNFAYAKPTKLGIGVGGAEGTRNAPTAANRLLSSVQFLDGRADSLEEQALGPLTHPKEMGNSEAELVKTLSHIEGYRLQFDTVFEEGITLTTVAQAIAAFERALVSGPSAWDVHKRLKVLQEHFDEEDQELLEEIAALQDQQAERPFSEAAKRGADLFYSDRAGCAQCHAGANFTDEAYHNLGVGTTALANEPTDQSIDWGRFTVTGEEVDRGAFKTPSLRNVAQTAPYMHDGSIATLEEVVAFYVAGGQANPHLSPLLGPLELSAQDQADLVAFLTALSGQLPEVEQARLPK